MCGIVGIINLDSSDVDEHLLLRMVNTIPHRGPDNADVYIDGNIGLGHTRLSILDISNAGNQPMVSTNKDHVIVYNGEIYNFLELKKDLENEGVEFYTQSDTEVVLNAFIQWGASCLERMNGMFSFVIVDLVERKVFCARDRFGIKPFYYALIDHHFVFSSEVKSISKVFGENLSTNSLKILELLTYREMIHDTLFNEIKSLEPGSALEMLSDSQRVPKIDSWFHVSTLPDSKLYRRLASISQKERIDYVDKVLNDSVQRHLVSDVPVGTLCSGGIDSSLLTAIACKIRSDVSVFHVDVKGVSERSWAERVADHLKIELHCFELDKANFLAKYIECIYHNDFPLTHPNSVPIYYVSELARSENCKVLITGEGADELFGGYHWRYRLLANYLQFSSSTTFFSKIWSKLLYIMTEVYSKKLNPDFRFVSRADTNEVLQLLSDQNYRKNLREMCEQSYNFLPKQNDKLVAAAMLADYRDYIAGILLRQDRASMQASIESRVPFLDVEVARVAANLPLKEKISRRESKLLLKQLSTRYLPNDVVYRPKIGFGTPADEYIKGLGDSVLENGFLQKELNLSVREVLRYLDKNEGNCHMVYGMEFWGRMFIWGESFESLQEQYIG